jgi:predicted nucleic acid-binding Zn ribbon protein
MKQTPDQQLKWKLARERFHLEDPCPPPERRPEKPISEILNKILKKDETDPSVLPKIIAERWPLIAGEQLAGHVRPSHLKKGILHLYADHPGWLAESKRLPKAQMLKKITSIKDMPDVKDLRFQLDPALLTIRAHK